MTGWNNMIIIVCVLIAVIAVYLEYRRYNKRNLGLRICAAVLAVGGLLGLIYPFSYVASISISGKTKLLLTEGFNTDSANNSDSIFTLDPKIYRKFPQAKLIATADELFADTSKYAPICILGYGLDEISLEQLNGKPVTFSPSPIPDGFIAAKWTEQLRSGQRLIVQGVYKNKTNKRYRLYLSGLSTIMDSTIIQPNSNTSFDLTVEPKNIGRALYKLIIIEGKDTISTEDLSVNIEPSKRINVLMLSASPNFEVKFLKDWLATKGYGVVSRSAISKGKFALNYLNMDAADLSKISPSLLSKFDAVMGDLSVLSNLSPAESNALQTEIAQKGLGLIIRADSSNKKANWLQGNFPLNRPANAPSETTILTIAGSGKTAKTNVSAERINLKNDTRLLIGDKQGRSLAASSLNGSGKLVFTTLQDTYTWMLSGNKDDYAKVWSSLIEEALRKLPPEKNWQVDTHIPMPGQQVSITSEGQFPANGVIINQDRVYAAQDPSIPFRDHYTYWPERSGWQQIKPENGKSFWWYVWRKGSFKSIIAAEKIAATQKFVDENRAAISRYHQVDVKTKLPISKIWFFILFLMAATFLWTESKFFSS